MMSPSLIKKIDQGLRLLATESGDDRLTEVAFSGGKDSAVILELARMSGIRHKAVYKNTTIDPPHTLAYSRDCGAEVLRPKMSFYELLKQKGQPSRTARFCCEVLKEYKVLDTCIQGIRRSESHKRAERYHEPQVCRVYSKNERVKVYLPILYWSDEDVLDFIRDRRIRLHPLYYDANGRIDVRRRLGCIACPLASERQRIAEFRRYPQVLRMYLRGLDAFLQTHPRKGYTAEDMILLSLRYHSYARYEEARHTLFGYRSAREELDDIFPNLL